MVPKYSLAFREADAPIRDMVTKFGGQPVWLVEPQWPLSRATGKPMKFICQIALAPEVFGDMAATMAYVFMMDSTDWVDDTWDPDSGENAVILQPGTPVVPTQALTNGPTLYREAGVPSTVCEFAVELELDQDPDTFTDDMLEESFDDLDANKIGGTPIFIQADEYPPYDDWKLLLQLDSAAVPFIVEFGDAGVGYAFISADGTQAQFLWQCY